MSKTTDLNNTVEEVLSSYETRIAGISAVFDTAKFLLTELPGSILDDKEKREKINNQLRDLLAKNGHLRRKDFDNMMLGVLSLQEEREKEVKELVKEYFNEQLAAAQALKKAMEEFKGSLTKGGIEKVKKIQAAIKGLLIDQDARRFEVTSRLKEFRLEQQELPQRLGELLAKGEALRIKDFKSMLDRIKSQREERIELNKKRREEVAKMLQDFRHKRQREYIPIKAVHPVGNTAGVGLEGGGSAGVNIDQKEGVSQSR